MEEEDPSMIVAGMIVPRRRHRLSKLTTSSINKLKHHALLSLLQ
jgi:hypothetical protein